MDLPQFALHAALEEHHWWFAGRRAILRVLLEELLPPDGTHLLIDVGCGTGGITAALSPAYRCIGIDPIPEAIAQAQRRFPTSTYRVGYAPKDVPEMREADGVLLMDVLEHLPDDFRVVSEILAAMKPGALLFLMAPADLSLWGQHDRGFNHERRYDLPRLRRLWQGLPVEELLASSCNTRLYPLAKAARALSRMMGRSWGGADTDLSLPPRPLNALLTRIFAREAKRLLGVLRGKARPYRRGISVFAVLRRGTGAIEPRNFPPDLPRDPTPWR
ncbi:MAG: class I SAM-dependent methyltransferase [Candidatus Peribacteraceae bacterium]|nr:class I SAM-dependent methyltransferase [Candidatus Peribacteraceae bacterium]